MFVTTHAVVPIFVMHILISCSTTSLAFPTASLLSIALALCSIALVGVEVLLLRVDGVVGVGGGWVAGVKAWPPDNPFLLAPSPSSFRPISDLLEVSRAESPANPTHLVTSSDSPRRFTVCVAWIRAETSANPHFASSVSFRRFPG